MKKALLVVGSMIALAGCAQQAGQVLPGGNKAQTPQGAMGEFAEVSQALQKGGSAECVMVSEDGTQITYKAKDKKIRMTNVSSDEVGTSQMIMDGEYSYSWSDESKQGVKFKVPTEEEMEEMQAQYQDQSQTASVPDFSDQDSVQKYEDLGFTVNCEVKDVADSEFVPPTDVTFTDASAMMDAMKGYGAQQ